MPWKITSLIGERVRLIRALLRGQKSVKQCAQEAQVIRAAAQRHLREARKFSGLSRWMRLTAMVRNVSKPVGGVCTGMSFFSG